MSEVFECAVRLLARREHSAHELTQKLKQKKYNLTQIQQAIDRCQQLDLQNDERYAASLCRVRMGQGYGPLRIRQELQKMNVDESVIAAAVFNDHNDWSACAKAVWLKKYKNEVDESIVSVYKQKQFLLYRGFTLDTIGEIYEKLRD